MAITTIPEFAEACKGLESGAIYVLFYDALSQALRDEIHITFVDLEPARHWKAKPSSAAMHMMGVKYNIQSLQDY